MSHRWPDQNVHPLLTATPKAVLIALLAGLLAGSTGCTLKPKCENGPGDVPGQCLPWPPPAPLINYGGL